MALADHLTRAGCAVEIASNELQLLELLLELKPDAIALNPSLVSIKALGSIACPIILILKVVDEDVLAEKILSTFRIVHQS